MKVLMVTSSYPRFPGDVVAPFIESIARSVAERGHQVDVVLPHHPRLCRGADEPVRFFPYRYSPWETWSLWGYAQSLEADVRVRKVVYLLAPLVALALRRSVARLLETSRYDVAHVHWVVPNAALIADVLAAHRTPFVVSVHGSDVFLAERWAPAGLLARHAFRRAGAVTGCSADLTRRACRLGAAPARARTVPYGVDVDAFSPGRHPRLLREQLGLRSDVRLVLAVGRLVEKKGFRYLVEAASRLEGLHVVIAGEGDLRGELQAQAHAARAPVTLVGNLDRDGVASALAAADIVVVPSVVDRAGNVDGLPNTLLEALAAGRPIVATRVAGIPDVLEDDVNGVLVPAKDVGALTDALRRLASEPETRERLGRRARRTAVERLSWQASACAFEEAYAQAAALDAR